MIAVDTSSLVAYLAGEGGRDVEALDQALAHGHAPPIGLGGARAVQRRIDFRLAGQRPLDIDTAVHRGDRIQHLCHGVLRVGSHRPPC